MINMLSVFFSKKLDPLIGKQSRIWMEPGACRLLWLRGFILQNQYNFNTNSQRLQSDETNQDEYCPWEAKALEVRDIGEDSE